MQLSMRRCFFAGLSLAWVSSAEAEPVVLGNDTLKSTVTGKTVHLDTPFGVAIPITYHANGLMSGKAGLLETFLGAQADRGRWWVADGKLCQKWFKWLDAQPNCMRLAQDGNKIFWRRDDGLSGTATIATGLALGAEAAPRGLGGPIEPAAPARSSAATGPSVHRSAATPTPTAPAHSETKPPARAIAAVRQAPHHETHEIPQTHVSSVHAADTADAPAEVRTVEALHSGQDERWCQAGLAGTAAGETTPDLVMVARLSATSEVRAGMNACLAADPALRQLARLGIDWR